MIKRTLAVVPLFAALVSGGCTQFKPLPPMPGEQTRQTLDKTVPHHVRYRYLVYLPEGYDGRKAYPLVMFLHGAGERGSDVGRVAAWGPPKLVAAGRQFGFVLVSPQCEQGDWWRVDDLEVLLKDVERRYAIDRSRVYLTGLSMGGCATWDWLLRDANTFAAAVPVCGWSNPVEPAYVACRTPVWAFHGEADPVIPVEGSRRMVEAFRKRGVEARLTTYPGVGHNAWTATYANPEVYEWMLSHRLAAGARGESAEKGGVKSRK
jgi:predicted peptidase